MTKSEDQESEHWFLYTIYIDDDGLIPFDFSSVDDIVYERRIKYMLDHKYATEYSRSQLPLYEDGIQVLFEFTELGKQTRMFYKL
jgi:hypothetical protein